MILVNGKQSDTVSVHDRGLLYGDGVFETIAIRNGNIEFFEQHLQRLAKGCESLLIPKPDIETIRQEAQSLRKDKANQVLKIIITRGQSERGYQIPDNQQPTRIIELAPLPDYPSEYTTDGVSVMLCQHRLGINPALAGIKHLNRLEQVLARNEIKNTNFAEGLMMDLNSHIIEGTMTNIFAVKAGKLTTPDLSGCGVAGVMRAVMLELAEEDNIPCNIVKITQADLLSSDEIFLTNSLIGVWPVRNIGEQKLKPGEITKKLKELICQ